MIMYYDNGNCGVVIRTVMMAFKMYADGDDVECDDNPADGYAAPVVAATTMPMLLCLLFLPNDEHHRCCARNKITTTSNPNNIPPTHNIGQGLAAAPSTGDRGRPPW